MATAGGYIYLITNLVNGKYYVGQTNNIQKRVNAHFSASRRGKPFPINRAIRKYGGANFLVEEIACAANQAELDRLEATWILALQSHTYRFGYNRRLGGAGTACVAETRALMSAVAKKRPPLWGSRLRQSMIDAGNRGRATQKRNRMGDACR